MNNDSDTHTILLSRTKTEKPPMYKVLLLNDDYTPMDFVVDILQRFFGKNQEESTHIMLTVHEQGVGICGVYPFEVAHTKAEQANNFARVEQHPLQCTLEKE